MDDQGQSPAIRAGDRDRDQSIERLGEAVAEGRMTLEEFSERVDLAQSAQTQAELSELTSDLPQRAVAGTLPVKDRHMALCSKLVRRGPWELAVRSSFRCICGTVVLDLSEARLSGSDSQLELYNLFGTVTVIVPDGLQVSVGGGGLFASEVIDPSAGSGVAGAPRLRITSRGAGGTLYVRTPREPRSRRLGGLLGGSGSGSGSGRE